MQHRGAPAPGRRRRPGQGARQGGGGLHGTPAGARALDTGADWRADHRVSGGARLTASSTPRRRCSCTARTPSPCSTSRRACPWPRRRTARAGPSPRRCGGRCGRYGIVRPYVGVVHRLDRGASGLVLFTTRGVANQSMHRQFAEHRIERTYRVLVDGDAPAHIDCDAKLADLPGGARGWPSPASPAAAPRRHASAGSEPETPTEGTSLLEAVLETGRTHQIRLHAAHVGPPRGRRPPLWARRGGGAAAPARMAPRVRPSGEAAPRSPSRPRCRRGPVVRLVEA